MVWRFAGQYQFGAIEEGVAANTRAAALSIAMPLLRCIVAIGEGALALGKETYGLGKDIAAARQSNAAVGEACPRYDEFVKCTQTCGGQGVDSEFADQRAKSRCDQDPTLKGAFRSLAIMAFQTSCYELYCKENYGQRTSEISQCMVTTKANIFFKDPTSKRIRAMGDFAEECCNPDTANVEKCAALAVGDR